jgi:cyclase
MFRPRVIPVLLLENKGLVKTTKFKDARYIGDPLNAVKIFNDLKADELAFLDINASNENRTIDIDLVRSIGEETFMPFSVGGGINSIEKIEKILSVGTEKVIINTAAVQNPELISEASSKFGAQSIIVSIDVKKSFFGNYNMFIRGGKVKVKESLIDFVKKVERLGAGEILLNSIDRDGTRIGYDIELIKAVAKEVNIPLVACGGASDYRNLKMPFNQTEAHAVAAGSIFVFHGKRNAVLINYPDKTEMEEIFNGDNNE